MAGKKLSISNIYILMVRFMNGDIQKRNCLEEGAIITLLNKRRKACS